MPASPNSDPLSPPRKRPRTHAPIPQPPSVDATLAPTINTNTSTSTSSTLSAPSIPPSNPYLFPIQPLHRFQGTSARIKRPYEVTHFSYDDNHEYREDESGINYYYPPKLGTDLREGFDTFRRYEDKEDPHLDSLLKALVEREKRGEERVQADFVTWRGMMTKILTAPFDFFAQFDMYATLHEGTIYIEEDFHKKATEIASQNGRPFPQIHNPNPTQPSYEMMTYWGYKFETLSLISTPPPETPQTIIDARPQAPVSNYAQHCSIVRTAFGNTTLILGGEVDGLWAPKPNLATHPEAPIPWIELKTSEELPPHRPNHAILKFERKLLKFWAQSFLLGVSKVIVGFRSKQGILKAVDVYETGQIPGMVRRGTQCWDGNTCINFATAFLAQLKEVVTDDGLYRIALKKKGGAIEVEKVNDSGTQQILSAEFLEWRDRCRTREKKA